MSSCILFVHRECGLQNNPVSLRRWKDETRGKLRCLLPVALYIGAEFQFAVGSVVKHHWVLLGQHRTIFALVRGNGRIGIIENLQSFSIEAKPHEIGSIPKHAVRICRQMLFVGPACVFLQEVAHGVRCQTEVRQTICFRVLAQRAQNSLQLLLGTKIRRLRGYSGPQKGGCSLEVVFPCPQFCQPERCGATQARLTVGDLVGCFRLTRVAQTFLGNTQVISNLGVGGVALLRELKEAIRFLETLKRRSQPSSGHLERLALRVFLQRTLGGGKREHKLSVQFLILAQLQPVVL